MTAAILNHLWQSSLFALAVWVLTFLFRNNSASVRHGLWLAASLKFLLPFSALAAIGGLMFTHTVAPGSLQALGRVAPAVLPFAVPPAVAVAQPPHIAWTLLIAAGWGIGTLAVLLFWLARAMRLWAIVHAATPLALNAPIPVRVTSQLLEPGLAGIFRPLILLPESLAQKLSKSEIDAILAHELCHYRRRDNLAALVQMLVEAVFWFHPLVWFIGARLVEEREQACDEGVLDEGKKPLDYAQAILKVCRLYFRVPLPCASGVSGADLDRRITAIMVRRDPDAVDPNKILLLAGLGALVVMTPLVLGGLKQAAPARLVQSLVQAIAPAAPAPPVAPVPQPRWTQHMTRPAFVKPESRLVSAPDIDASIPIIVVPSPQLAPEPVETAAPEILVCRAPQQFRDSRLLGPQVCLPQRVWDRFKAQGLVLQPDGKTLTMGYDDTRLLRPMTCQSMGTNASAATNWFIACRQ